VADHVPKKGFVNKGLLDATNRAGMGHKNPSLIEGTETSLTNDRSGFINLGRVSGVVSVIIIAVVTLLILAALAPTFLSAVNDTVHAVEDADTGNTTANTLLSVFGLLIAFAGLFAIVALVMRAVRIGKG